MLFTLAFNPDSFELRILVFNVFGALRSWIHKLGNQGGIKKDQVGFGMPACRETTISFMDTCSFLIRSWQSIDDCCPVIAGGICYFGAPTGWVIRTAMDVEGGSGVEREDGSRTIMGSDDCLAPKSPPPPLLASPQNRPLVWFLNH
jgi:hypothetical protein